jgi:hypothetical protein
MRRIGRSSLNIVIAGTLLQERKERKHSYRRLSNP